MSKSRRPSQAADDIDLASLGQALWRAKAWILTLAIGIGVITFAVLSMMRPLYTSEARILVQNDESAFTRPTTDRTPEPRTSLDEQAVQSQVQVLTSRDLIREVVTDLDLVHNQAFARDAGVGVVRRLLASFGLGLGTPESEEERAANALAEHLDVYQLSKSSVIAVEYTSGDPELAAQIANKLADVYIGWQRTAKIAQTKDATAWLKDQIDVLRKRVAESEEAVETFKAKEGLYSGTNNVTLNAQQLSELNSQLILAEAEESEARARAKLIKQMLADKGDIDATPEVLKSQLIINLIAQRVQVQRQLAELSATLLPSHPRIQQLRSELADVRAQIRSEAAKVVKSLENEADVAAAREASLRTSLNAAKTQSAGLSDAEIKLRALEREAKANRDLLESYLARYQDAAARHDMGSVPAQATIVSRAHPSVLPSFPRRGPLTALVMAATVLLAVAYILARELIAPPAVAGYAPRPREHQQRRPHRRPDTPAYDEPQPAYMPPSGDPATWAAKPKQRPRRPAQQPAASTIAPERKLPVVTAPAKAASESPKAPAESSPMSMPMAATMAAAGTEAVAEDEAAPRSATPPAWQAKPAKRPSWLQVSTPRRKQTPKEEPAAVPEAKQEAAPVIEKPIVAKEEAATPAAKGLFDRLKEEFSDEDSNVATARESEPGRASGLLGRFRRGGGKGGESNTETTPKGVDMAALSPNDLRHYLTQRIATSSADEPMPQAPKVGRGKVEPVLKSMDAVLDRVLESGSGGAPRAVLVAGLSPKADATQTAIALARALASQDEPVVLVDLAKGSAAVSGPLGMPRVPGFSDLATGRASFSDVIRIDEDSPLQVITAGNPGLNANGREPDQFMRVFEALTEAYGCVVLHADLAAIAALMPALKFELPVLVAVAPKGGLSAETDDALSAYQALGCPVVLYEGNGKARRVGLFSRIAAV